MDEREKMLKQVQIANFALIEVTQYLDGHPEDELALEYYHKYQTLLAEATETYERKFGPLTSKNVYDRTAWTWISHPWPWEMEE